MKKQRLGRRHDGREPATLRLLPAAIAALEKQAVARFGSKRKRARIVEELLLLRSPYERVKVDMTIRGGPAGPIDVSVAVRLNLATGRSRVRAVYYCGAKIARDALRDHEEVEAIRAAWETWKIRRVRAGLEGA